MRQIYISNDTLQLAKSKGLQVEWEYDLDVGASWEMRVTQSMLQKWLREEHSINIFVEHGAYRKDKITYDLTITGIGCLRGSYPTYEKALEIGLQTALKQIKDKDENSS